MGHVNLDRDRAFYKDAQEGSLALKPQANCNRCKYSKANWNVEGEVGFLTIKCCGAQIVYDELSDFDLTSEPPCNGNDFDLKKRAVDESITKEQAIRILKHLAEKNETAISESELPRGIAEGMKIAIGIIEKIA